MGFVEIAGRATPMLEKELGATSQKTISSSEG